MFNIAFRLYKPSAGSSLRVTELFLALLLASGQLHAQFVSSMQLQTETLHNRARNAMQQGNYAIAYCIWQPLAQQGNSLAQYNIGWMYHNGYGLSIDDEMALYWWFRSAASGDANSHFALGDLYAQGQGVEKDLTIALGWYISAALKKHEPARETLMALLENDDELSQTTFKQLLQSDWSMLGDSMEVKVDRANIRRGPDQSYKVVTTLERGHVVIPLKEQNGWTYIGITGKGETGWIFSRLLGKPAGLYPVE